MIDYKNNLISVTNSLLKHYNAKTHHQTLPVLDDVLKRNYQHVIVILLDGLGINVLNQLDENSILRKNLKTTLSSVFPPTTVAATNAFLTGKTPYETGFLGWAQYNKFEDVTDTIFLKTNYYSEAKIKDNLYDRLLPEDFLEQIKKVNPDLHVEAIFPKPIQMSTYETLEEQLNRLLMITKGTKSLSYCYYPEPDSTIHTEGISGSKTIEVLNNLDQAITNFKNELDSDVLTIIIADHGLVDIEYVYLEDYQDILNTFYRLPSIEQRTKTFFIQPGQESTFIDLFNKHLQPGFKLYNKKALMDSKILGYGEKHPLLDTFIGEFTAVSVSNKAINYKREDNAFKAHHAGYLECELMIPLIILD